MPLYDGPVVDSHHHIFWDLDKNYPWMHRPMRPMIFGDDWSALKQPYSVHDLKADFATHDVVASVHVQANFDINRPVDETKGLQEMADAEGFPSGIVGHADLTDPNLERVIAGHREHANTRGIRQQVYWHPTNPYWRFVERDDFCMSTSFRRGLSVLSDNDLTFDFQGFANQFVDLAMLARENANLSICLVHAGMLTATDAPTVSAWREALEVLVPCENVFIKVSGLNTFTRTLDETIMDIAANTAIDMFGVDRCFFGSNYPVERMWCRFEDYVAVQKKVLAHRSAEENRKFFHDTARAFYKV
jgi:predicted TIM-barrel fold metal-dependent hydrolase